MYITIQEASKVLGVSEVSVYSYIKSGRLRTDPERKKIMVEISSVYKLRGEKRQ